MKRLKKEIRDRLKGDRKGILAIAGNTGKLEITIARQVANNHELLTTEDALAAIMQHYSLTREDLLEEVQEHEANEAQATV